MDNGTNKLKLTNGIVILGMLLLGAIIISAILRDRIVNQPWREVQITGTGKVEYVPDTAHVVLGVQIEAATAQSALSQLNSSVEAVIPAVEALGIPRENIGTQNLSVFPQYYYPEGGPSRISGYTASQQLAIEIPMASSSADMVSRVIQTASAQGANQVQSVTFDASNLEELKQAAVLEAIADARGRAQTVADAAGVKLGKINSWWENPVSVPGNPMPYYESARAYGMGGDFGGGMGMVPSGTSEVIMQVTLNYATK